MSTPVTTRLDPAVVDALDKAVSAGLASTRAALTTDAVSGWLARHGEDAVVGSYRRRYEHSDPDHDALVAQIGAFSAAACLALDGRSSYEVTSSTPTSRAQAGHPVVVVGRATAIWASRSASPESGQSTTEPQDRLEMAPVLAPARAEATNAA